MTNEWTIICPGPSIWDYIAREKNMVYTPGQLIAVNGAIAFDFPYSHWAVGDQQVFAHAVCLKMITRRIEAGCVTLWTADRWPSDIRERYPELTHAYENGFKHEYYPCANWDDLAMSMPFGRDLDWRTFTLLTALARAVKKGANRIRVYGADFAGDKYAQPGFENDRTNLSPDRWRCEYEAFLSIQTRCAMHDIIITRNFN